MELREWLVIHVRHKDAYARKLADVKEAGDHVAFTYKDGVMHGYAYARLQPPPGEGRMLIATLQSKENIEELIRNWKAYSKHPELTIIFANPARNERWTIKPALHEKIADGDLGAGIWSMAADVTNV